jgi:prepilin-type N-terminal cleavage/methylation domain-containing protein
MKFFRLKLLHKNQAGYSIIEMMAAVVITGILAVGVSVSSAQLLQQTSRDTDFTSASRHASNAIYWMSRDALMAQNITGDSGFPSTSLNLRWKDWDNTVYSANYSVENGTLYRAFSNGETVTNTMIAQYINDGEDMTSCVSSNGTIILTVTSSVGEGARIINVTKTRRISNRPNL